MFPQTGPPLAGQRIARSERLNVARLVTAYFCEKPDLAIAAQRVAFGTSGHRGSALKCSFNENHILAISQAICRLRHQDGVTGPIFLGMDTHALSEPAMATALEVFAANDVTVMLDQHGGYTPTPVISHAILSYNRDRREGLADGVVITPSHNPPEDGGFKYNPPHGGPAGSAVTTRIEQAANLMLEQGLTAVRRISYRQARHSSCVHGHDFLGAYVADLANVIDMEAIAAASLKIGIDPLGGASLPFWQRIIETYRLTATITNTTIDPTFAFMPLDWDGKIRMDCSSAYAMAGLIGLRSRFDVAFANDTDADRHGIVTGLAGLMNPNHYLAAAVSYLYGSRTRWSSDCAVGKTVVSSHMIDRVAARIGRRVVEVPVGFKWFVDGLSSGALGFAGEESAGATFLRRDGSVWTTDKDGMIAALAAAEITACCGKDPSQIYNELSAELGPSFYARTDKAAPPNLRQLLLKLRPEQMRIQALAGAPVRACLTTAPGNKAPLGGIKVIAENGWFAARPSGTEDIYKIYAESFESEAHLDRIQLEAGEWIAGLAQAGGDAAADR